MSCLAQNEGQGHSLFVGAVSCSFLKELQINNVHHETSCNAHEPGQR
jgi:hypothetical protein